MGLSEAISRCFKTFLLPFASNMTLSRLELILSPNVKIGAISRCFKTFLLPFASNMTLSRLELILSPNVKTEAPVIRICV